MESEMITTDTNSRIEVANVIVRQLGGGKFKMMTGAKDFIAIDKGVQFMIPRSNNVRKVRVTLDGDLYRMEFYSIRGIDVKLVHACQGIYADHLQWHFTEVTGLETSL